MSEPRLERLPLIMKALLPLALALFSSLALAQGAAPDALIRTLTDDVLAHVREDRDLQTGDPQKLAALIQAKVVPHFDFQRVTEIAMGPAWRGATAEQRSALIEQFQRLLVRTYSGMLASYRGKSIEVLPLHVDPTDGTAKVHCKLRQSGQAPIVIDYDMERVGGKWMVFDVDVDGMSLALNYRSSFAEVVARGGIDSLITALTKRNSS